MQFELGQSLSLSGAATAAYLALRPTFWLLICHPMAVWSTGHLTAGRQSRASLNRSDRRRRSVWATPDSSLSFGRLFHQLQPAPRTDSPENAENAAISLQMSRVGR